MIRLPFILLFVFISINSFSQKRNNNWFFGEYAAVTFNTNPVSYIAGSQMTHLEGCASISDNNTGQLLFYSDGVTVWNRNHQVMQNGTGLLGNESSTQSALIIPKPGDNNVYYLFTVPAQSASIPLSYSVIDMTLDGGFGAVTSKNIALYLPVTEKLTATVKGNGIDYWIIAKEFNSDVIMAFSVTSAGVDITPVISHTGLTLTNLADVGYARFSPNGSKLCFAYLRSKLCQLFDFDKNTGIVSNPIDLSSTDISNPNNGPYGVEFSPDNSKLYIGLELYCTIRQYDLLAGSPAAIQNSAFIVLNSGNTQVGGALALGPDGKIYICFYHRPYLGVINSPNLAGAACNYQLQSPVVLLNYSLNGLGLPNYVHYPACAPVQNISNSAMICSNGSYQLPSGTIVSSAGVYEDTIRSIGNCDSIITTINLSVLAVQLLNSAVHICYGQTYHLPSGLTVSTEGFYADTVRSQSNCDSIIHTIHLFVDHVTLQNISAHICLNQSYQLPSGTIVSMEGIYADTLRSQAHCDSIINTVHLFVDHALLQNTEAHICPGQTYQLPSGITASMEGFYTDTVRSQASCDSIIHTIHLIVDQVSLRNSNVQTCSDETYHLPSGIVVTASGTYTDTVRSQAYCDSIIHTVHLVINDVSASNQVDSIYEGQAYTLPSGFIVHAAGNYQSVLTNSLGCDSVITTVLKLRRSIAECLVLNNAFTPNGDGINDRWILYRYRCFKKLEVSVYNRYGSLVYHADDYKNDWMGTYKNKSLPDGTYYYVIKVVSFDGKEHVYKNNVTIVR